MVTAEYLNSLPCKERRNELMCNFPANNRSIILRRSLFGVGINDACYQVKPIICGTPVVCPAYASWKRIIERSFCNKFKSKRSSYQDVTTCEEWLKFSSFSEWWEDNFVDGFHLDKDILTDKKIYSPDTCIFIPPWLNLFVTDRSQDRGKYPIGVCVHNKTGKFIAKCSGEIVGKKRHLGFFDSCDDAHNAWKERKLHIAHMARPQMDAIDERIFHGVVRIIMQAK